MSEPLIDPQYRGGEGTPLVLLHGLTGSWRVWKPLLPALEAHHEVFAPSLPGHAGAAALPDGFKVTMGDIADLLELQLDDAGIETAHIAGNSLGGWLALELGRRGRARSVTALSPAGAWSSPKDLVRVIRMFTVANAVMARFGTKLVPMMRRPRFRKLALGSVAERGELVTASDAVGLFQDSLDCLVIEDFLSWVRGQESFRIATEPDPHPVCIAWSEFDRTIPFERYGKPMLAAVPGARHVTLHGVGHVPMLDDPALVARTILETTLQADTQDAAAIAADGSAESVEPADDLVP